MTPILDELAGGLLVVANEDGLPEGITGVRGLCPNGCGETLESDDESGAVEARTSIVLSVLL